MPFDYEANLSAVYNCVAQANTTTAAVDLSSGMTTRVSDANIYKSDPAIVGLRGDIYPAVFVRVNKKTEDFAGIGSTGPARARKQATVLYDIVCFYRKDGAHSKQETVMTELHRFAENVEGVFQQECTLSGTAMWCQVRETNFYGPFSNEQVWIKAVVCNLEAKYHFR
jgi:hypothetical protein